MGSRDLTFEAFKALVPYLRGALWWARNALIKEKQREFNQNDRHIGHPLLSVKKAPVICRSDVIPMLVGTSGNKMYEEQKRKCICITGMTRHAPEHKTYFGSIIAPGRYEFDKLLRGVTNEQVSIKRNEAVCECGGEDYRVVRRAWHEYRDMHPNEDKLVVTAEERDSVDRWCVAHGAEK